MAVVVLAGKDIKNSPIVSSITVPTNEADKVLEPMEGLICPLMLYPVKGSPTLS